MNAPEADATLADWLAWQSGLHPREMDLGLERVCEVAEKLGLLPFPARVLTIAGTNGKGSCAFTLERLLSGEQRVGVYSSPYILRYNERVRIAGVEASDSELCEAFAAVEASRGNVALTYFEFGTLAALWLFLRAEVDVLILEVGMGGRLDAVNVVDADVAVITSIALDHTQWLGDDRESIGQEKAGIMRPGRPVICADREPPESIARYAAKLGAALSLIGENFDMAATADGWQWRSDLGACLDIPVCTALLPDNLAAALAALEQAGCLPDQAEIVARLAGFSIPGRRQIVKGPVSMLLDVAHNPAAMELLADWLRDNPVSGRNICVIGMLRDKAVAECVASMRTVSEHLMAAGLPEVQRGGTADWLRGMAAFSNVYETVDDALHAAREIAVTGDRIIVCGSFYTVSAAMQALPQQNFQHAEQL